MQSPQARGLLGKMLKSDAPSLRALGAIGIGLIKEARKLLRFTTLLSIPAVALGLWLPCLLAYRAAEALQQLDTAERSMLVLRDLEDCSYQEIADMLAIGMSGAGTLDKVAGPVGIVRIFHSAAEAVGSLNENTEVIASICKEGVNCYSIAARRVERHAI